MAIRLSKNYYGKDGISTNAQQVLTNISNRLRKYKDEVGNLTEWCAREFVNEAQERLVDSGYNVSHLTKNIVWDTQRSGEYYTVSFADNSDKDKMYYLEYGTGLVGEGTMPDPKGRKGDAHHEADKVGWEYAIGDTIHFSATGDKDGWFYQNENGDWKFTSGLRAVSYMYDTLQNFDQPNGTFERAMGKTKIKSILKG